MTRETWQPQDFMMTPFWQIVAYCLFFKLWPICSRLEAVLWMHGQRSSHTTALSKGTIFGKNSDFLQKMLALAKLRESWY